MVKQLRKALSRPTQLWALARQYGLFALTRQLSRWVFRPENGIFLGENVRVQRLACLSAERPGASVRLGRDCIVYEHARIQAYGPGTIEIGEGSIIGDARIYARESVRLGRRVVTSWNVFVQDFDPHPVEPELRAVQMIRMARGFKPGYRAAGTLPELEWSFPAKAISIGDDVWLGANVTVLKGARIGDGCVVATGSVVTAGDYPARSVLGGVPAKVIATLPAPTGASARAEGLVAALSVEAAALAEGRP